MIKNEKLFDSLIQIGLEGKEARVYMASLSLGPSTILRLSKISEVKRTTIYELIDSLEKKGLMKKEIHGFKTLYSAEHPERLENSLETKKILLAKMLPELEGMYHLKGTESSLKYYSGLPAIKNIYNDLLKELKPHDFYYAISNVLEWQELDEDFFLKNHIEKRSKMGIETKLLFTDSDLAQNRKRTERNFNEEVKILPENSKFHVDLVITPYKLVMFQLYDPKVAIVIENKSIIELQREMFKLIWSSIAN
ncbi:MAG: helix-turn-helix domain-containing protein [bacterium]